MTEIKKGRVVLVIGGARSGKSSFAFRNADSMPGRKAFIATAQPFDAEMKARIERHRAERGDGWVTYEEATAIGGLCRKISAEYPALIIDCLTLWLYNVISSDLDAEKEINALAALLSSGLPSVIYVVSNEVGMGIVPDNELSRRFRDLAGILNQKVAKAADEVYLMTAGVGLKIK